MRGKKTGGRIAGTPNILTKTVKDTLLEAFTALQEHPDSNLITWGENNPGPFYQIASKLIPAEISAKVDTTINNHDFSKYTPDELRKFLKAGIDKAD